MPIELKIPAVGESITEVQISEWLKSEGDSVKQDEPVAVIDSEKTTFDLPATHAGKLTKILHKAGETVAIGTVVAQLETEEKAGKSKSEETAAKPEAKGIDKSKNKAGKPEAAGESKIDEKPAENREVDGEKSKEEKPEPAESQKKSALEEAKAESKSISKIETKTPAKKPSSDREEEVVPMTMLRRTVARHLVEARQTMAMLTTFNEVDMSAVQALRREHQEAFEKRYQVKLGLMSFFVKATIDALKQFPQLNAEIRGNDIVYRNYFDIGVAIATDRGLVVPVLRNAERLSFAELEKAIGDFARRAKDGKLKPDDLEGGTFTITNGGAFGSLLSTPIINPPQTGILGMHTIQERPVAIQGQIVIRPMMYAALTYDHRIVDGREAVLCLRRVKEAVETPSRMLIEV
ncbi:MAG TPA: 2-oxoglutarate dehydrogenase complex dihydrolipoyllysine-residue succinyltransferase [Candidatus Dormibacteraeota bacterium]|nr:2-oxoglutarate dehydrogenase complex dihydrolipoyllysine-residue succinyltransferase [Candidatus Dormibacteraeota bacterium]